MPCAKRAPRFPGSICSFHLAPKKSHRATERNESSLSGRERQTRGRGRYKQGRKKKKKKRFPTRDVDEGIPGDGAVLAVEVEVEQSALPVAVVELVADVPAQGSEFLPLLPTRF